MIQSIPRTTLALATALGTALATLVLTAAPAQLLAQTQDTKVTLAISGWTGFAPLTLAKEAGLFKK